MLFTINGRDHPKKIAIETTISTCDVSATLRNTMVPAKYRLAFEETMVETTVMIITGVMSNEVITEMHQVPADKIIDPGFQGHTMCHPRNF
jgi:S-adenosylmethionine synthetase